MITGHSCRDAAAAPLHRCTALLTGSKAGGWGGKAKEAVAAVNGTVVSGGDEE